MNEALRHYAAYCPWEAKEMLTFHWFDVSRSVLWAN